MSLLGVFPPGRRRVRAGPAGLVAALVALSACGEPTRPVAPAADELAGQSAAVPAFPLADLADAISGEADRLRPAFGDRLTEHPLRLALRALEDGAVAHQATDADHALGAARGLLDGYRREAVADVDPAELDALDLLISSLDHVVATKRDEASRLGTPAIIKNNRRPT